MDNLLVRTEQSGAPIGTPIVLKSKDVPKVGSLYHSISYQMVFQLESLHYYTSNHLDHLYEAIVHATYSLSKGD